MRKHMSLLFGLLLGMVLLLLPVLGEAEIVYSGTCGEDLTWTLNDEGLLQITGSGYMTSNPWSDYDKSIKEIQIDEGVINIVKNAFDWCTNLTKVQLPQSLKTIGEAAFDFSTSFLFALLAEHESTNLFEAVVIGTACVVAYYIIQLLF